MKRIKVELDLRSYEIIIGRSIIGMLGKILRKIKLPKYTFIITNQKISSLYSKSIRDSLERAGFKLNFFEVPDTERSKSFKQIKRLLTEIVLWGREKQLFIVGFGGGVIGDTSGFCASVYKRGIPYIQIPTTLLAQIDSAIGGKTAIDLPVAKNMIGTFYQPKLVFSDILFLSTLNKAQLRSGLAEAIKYGVIKDGLLFEFIEREYPKLLNLDLNLLEKLVFLCSKIKAEIVSKDEREEKGIRTRLNFGHTIGHAIETASKFKTYSHGEAISVGMILASEISYHLGLLDRDSLSRIENIIFRVGLPTNLKGLKLEDILSSQAFDKKFIGKRNRFVLPVRIGKVIIYEDVPLRLIKKVISKRLL